MIGGLIFLLSKMMFKNGWNGLDEVWQRPMFHPKTLTQSALIQPLHNSFNYTSMLEQVLKC